MQSLCETCAYVREVRSRRGQRYLLCQNEAIADKYPRQPLLACAGYERHQSRGDEQELGTRQENPTL